MTHQTNDHGKVLIENWVEERACEGFDNNISVPVVNRSGHSGIITTSTPTSAVMNTTVGDTYKSPTKPNIRQKGMF